MCAKTGTQTVDNEFLNRRDSRANLTFQRPGVVLTNRVTDADIDILIFGRAARDEPREAIGTVSGAV